MRVENDIPSMYYLGRECRRNGNTKLANPFSPISYHGSWWLAGYNDCDLEIGQQKAKRRA